MYGSHWKEKLEIGMAMQKTVEQAWPYPYLGTSPTVRCAPAPWLYLTCPATTTGRTMTVDDGDVAPFAAGMTN